MKYLILIVLLPIFCAAQNPYPQDYFRSPMDIPLILSGTFAELRSNHFHSGLDIKTQQRTGLNIYAAAEGYVSRIKISHYGYGKALYITHPNGYVTVYAHLKKFAPRIENFIKKRQYEKETYEIELFLNPTDLPVSTDEIVALSGNSGSSGGPHLHFEIRDNAERPINPMLFGIDIKDSKAPQVRGIFAYPKNRSSHVNDVKKRQELRLIPLKNGDFQVEAVEAFGEIGFGIISNDQQDQAYNKNGVSNIQTFFNGNKNFEMDFKRFSFDETRHLNRYIDYEVYKTEKKRIQKLFVEPGNILSMLTDVKDDGYLKIEDSTSSIYKIRISDFKNNETWINIPIQGRKQKEILENFDLKPNYYVQADQSLRLEEKNVSVYFQEGTFYDNQYLDFSVRNDTLKLHRDVVPLMKNYTISYDIQNYDEKDKNKLFIAKLYGYYQRPSYIKTTRQGNYLTARTKYLGNFTLATDTISPTIKPVNFQEGKWMSKSKTLKVKIEDDLSGIANYRATINGKWILMEYDHKKDTLTYNFEDNIIADTQHNLKVIVIDNMGNSSTFEATFFRK